MPAVAGIIDSVQGFAGWFVNMCTFRGDAEWHMRNDETLAGPPAGASTWTKASDGPP